MILILSELNDPATDNSKHHNTTDFFGFGKAIDSLAKSFGKLLEKIPSNKLSAGMSFVVIVLILYLIFIPVIFKVNPNNAPLLTIWVGIFMIIFCGPFIFIEFYKEINNLKK